jgi:hypothetical protein
VSYIGEPDGEEVYTILLIRLAMGPVRCMKIAAGRYGMLIDKFENVSEMGHFGVGDRKRCLKIQCLR